MDEPVQDQSLPSGPSVGEPDRSPAGIQAPKEQPMAAPPAPEPNTSVKSVEAGEAGGGVIPTLGQRIGQAVSEGLHGSAIGTPSLHGEDQGYLTRYLQESQMEEKNRLAGISKITPDQANKQFPGMSFTTPVDPYVAQLQFDAKQRREADKEFALRGNALSGFTRGLIAMGVGALDPINVALMAITPALGISKYVGSGVKTVLAENALINTALAVPEFLQNKHEGENVTAAGVAGNIALGTVGGTALHYTIAGLAHFLGKGMEAVKGQPKDIRQENMRTVISQSEGGAKIEPPSGGGSAREAQAIEGKLSPFNFEAVKHPSEMPYWAGADASGFPTERLNLGPGLQARESFPAQNAHVSNPGGEPGNVARIDISPEAKYLNVEQPAGSLDKKLLSDIEYKSPVPLGFEQGQSIKDVLQRLGDQAGQGGVPSDILSQAQELFKAAGYEGYYGVIDHPGGAKENFVHTFDENHAPSQVLRADASRVQLTDPSERQRFIEDQYKPESSQHYTPEQAKALRDDHHGKPLNHTPEEMDPFLKEQYDTARAQLDEWAKTDPELAQQIKEQLDGENKVDGHERKVAKIFGDCVARTMM